MSNHQTWLWNMFVMQQMPLFVVVVVTLVIVIPNLKYISFQRLIVSDFLTIERI